MRVKTFFGPVRAALLAMVLFSGCTTVRELKAPQSLTVDGKAHRTRTKDALDYSVAIQIDAPPQAVWDILADGQAYLKWNTTLLKLDGNIALGGKIKLLSKVNPNRVFDLKVTRFDAPKAMVWEDGGRMFLGVRHFYLMPAQGGTIFAMSETYSGFMLGMLEKKLPDMTQSFERFGLDLKAKAESK